MPGSIRTDVTVIGGGFLGANLAWNLARDGVRCILLDAGELNSQASGRNAGSLHFQLEYRMIEQGLDAARTAAEAIPLHLEAARIWANLADAVGEDLGVQQHGGLMLAETPEQANLLEAKVEIERSWGLDVQILTRSEVARLAPYLADSVLAAALCPAEGKANTRQAGPALARAASALGASILTQHRVTRIERETHGWRVEGFGADTGPFSISSDSVVIAGGVRTTELAQMMGARLSTYPVALTMMVSARTPQFIGHLIQHAGARLSLKQAPDGNVLIGGGWPSRLPVTPTGEADFSRVPTLMPESIRGNAQAAMRVVPALATLPVLRSWTGTTSLTPDQLPLIGPIRGCPGAFVATGGSAFTLGPAYARLLADLVQGRHLDFDISRYRPDRFEGADVA